MVEGARLESVFRGNSNVGSNPTLSASQINGLGESLPGCKFPFIQRCSLVPALSTCIESPKKASSKIQLRESGEAFLLGVVCSPG